MQQEQAPNRRSPDRLVETISNASVRGFYNEILTHLDKLHPNVVVRQSDVDVRAEFAGKTLCRIVPYRELLHLQIGDSPTWEIRVRDEGGFIEAMGRILDTFLRLAADDGGKPETRSGPR